MLTTLRRLWGHVAWADLQLLSALETDQPPPAQAIREYVHILGADEVWLARLTRRPATSPVWPTMELPQVRTFVGELHAGYSAYLSGIDEAVLPSLVSYTNSAGQSFVNTVQDIMLHVVLHAQYHRGKVNLLLRQADLTPAPTDFMAYIRSVPAAKADAQG
jgi:uncharacterized damage-inducible protein DinB